MSDGDPAVAFGPIPDDNGEFDWDNGSRLYYANLTSNLSVSETITFKGFEAIGVSRIDGDPALTPAIVADEDNWLDPVIVSKQSSATFADKEQLWVDNAESSPFFGNAYVCFARFQGGGAAPMTLATSTDSGDTWSSDQVSPGQRRSSQVGPVRVHDPHGQRGRRLRHLRAVPEPRGVPPPNGSHFMVKSFDGGQSWTRPQLIQTINDPCYALQFDGSIPRCVQDGIAGARNDLAASPNISIANGAPTGPMRRMGSSSTGRALTETALSMSSCGHRPTVEIHGRRGRRRTGGGPGVYVHGTGLLPRRRRHLPRLQCVHHSLPR